jgi:hypothetical protein
MPARAHRVERMQGRQQQQRIGGHAMLELHGQRVVAEPLTHKLSLNHHRKALGGYLFAALAAP